MHYDNKIIERGKEYYKNGLVKFCVKFGDFLYGKVIGGDTYDVKVDLSNYFGSCSCPYKYNCKHAYALIEAYKNNNYIDGDELFNSIGKKPKEEILEILKGIILKHNLWDDLIGKEDNLVEKGKAILKLIPAERKNIYTFKSFLRNQFIKNASDDELLEMLEEIANFDYFDYDDRDVVEIIESIVVEIFERGNKKTAKKALELSKKYTNALWIVREYFYDYCIEIGEIL
jgi:uncharacterized Zn finger protein